MKTIAFLTVFLITAFFTKAQVTEAYGGYMQSQGVSGLSYRFEVVVFFATAHNIPDSITLEMGDNASERGFVQSKTALCNAVKAVYAVMHTYKGAGVFNSNAHFAPDTVVFKNTNKDFFLYHALIIDNGIGPVNTSPHFKELPLIEVEKGRSMVLNLFGFDDKKDSIYFYSPREMKNGTFVETKNIRCNPFTADFLINSNMDTGWYNYVMSAADNDTSWGFQKSRTYNCFTIHVSNERVAYFTPIATKTDTQGIYYIDLKQTDKTISYQTNYTRPKGFANYNIILQSHQTFSKAPIITSTQKNDTTLLINVTIPLDSADAGIYKKPPFSISLMVNHTDSLGNCQQDLTSFYVNNNIKTGMNEESTLPAISMYPNPAQQKLYINLSNTTHKNLQFHLFDSKGTLVKILPLTHNEIDISELKQGLYFITITGENTFFKSKLVKE